MGYDILFTEIYQTEDTGETRRYNFRRIQTTTIRFQVKAGHDVAVCLSSDNEEEPEDMYEVFIGCWGGGESGIRRKKHDDVIRVETPDILCEDEFRTFWIKIQRGTIKVSLSLCHTPTFIFTYVVYFPSYDRFLGSWTKAGNSWIN